MFCDAPTKDWRGQPETCNRRATDTIGALNLCWQHAAGVRDQVAGELDVDGMSARITRLEEVIRRRQWREAQLGRGIPNPYSVVYFAQMPNLAPGHAMYGLVKIGHSALLKGRMRDLSTDVIATIPGGRQRELVIHAQFAHLLRHRREWFDPAPDLLCYIEDVA